MDIRTSDGIKIFVLPENARCELSGQSPEDMLDCPLGLCSEYNGDCVPDVCEHYIEMEALDEQKQRF